MGIDWRSRCKYIYNSCIMSFTKSKLYFEKDLSSKAFTDKHKIYSIFDLKKIRAQLKKPKNTNISYYSNHTYFYKDMILFWNNLRWKNLTKKKLRKTLNNGFKTFKKEWYRFFIEKSKLDDKKLRKKIRKEKSKINNLNSLKTEIYKSKSKKNPECTIRRTVPKKKIKGFTELPEINKERSTTMYQTSDKHLTQEEISSLVDALTNITNDTNHIARARFEEMIKIFQEAGKLEYDETGHIEVDFRK